MKKKKYIILIALAAVVLIITMYAIKEINDVKNTIAIDEEIRIAIQNYLDNEFREPVKDGKVLSSYIIRGAKKNEIYLSAFIKEYLDPSNTTHGLLIELVLIVEKTENGIIIKDYKWPPDGTNYGKTIKKWFSKEAYENLMRGQQEGDSVKMEQELDERAKQWFE